MSKKEKRKSISLGWASDSADDFEGDPPFKSSKSEAKNSSGSASKLSQKRSLKRKSKTREKKIITEDDFSFLPDGTIVSGKSPSPNGNRSKSSGHSDILLQQTGSSHPLTLSLLSSSHVSAFKPLAKSTPPSTISIEKEPSHDQRKSDETPLTTCHQTPISKTRSGKVKKPFDYAQQSKAIMTERPSGHCCDSARILSELLVKDELRKMIRDEFQDTCRDLANQIFAQFAKKFMAIEP